MVILGFHRYAKGQHKSGQPRGHQAFRQASFLSVWRTRDDDDYDLDDSSDLGAGKDTFFWDNGSPVQWFAGPGDDRAMTASTTNVRTRDATVYIVGIVTRFLHEKGLIDERALRDYVRTFEGDTSGIEDYMGGLVRRLGNMIDFHDRYPTNFVLADWVRSSGARSDHAAQPSA